MINLQLYYENLPESDHEYFKKLLQKEVNKIDKYLENYPTATLKVNAEQTKTSLFQIKAILFLNNEVITNTKEDRTLEAVIKDVFSVLKENLTQFINKNK